MARASDKIKVRKALFRKVALAVAVMVAVAVGLARYPGIEWNDVFQVVLASFIFVAILAMVGCVVGFTIYLFKKTDERKHRQ